ncbi:MAG: prolyl aminopeptidase [SAR86 cluster bacterium]|uniref:Proline iminopeptidase n=1 Tax=SAR86 cluster bacterium TaxID=2030880 RepID=A0A937JBF6_9GAMM|nr:prolyl aminopeptidase [SAR86 cluster bacterium]
MENQLNLYPKIKPYDSGFLNVDEHQIYFEQCGNPNGKPALFLHGGPGGGGSKEVRRFFNPDIYRIIVIDQRGCGRSKPHGCLENNTTWHLVSDIDNLREKLGIEKWLVFGGSWGSTLSLAYAQAHPKSVSELVLRGIFLLRKEELHWFYQDGASRIFPEAWSGFLDIIDEDKRDNLMSSYREIFKSDDKERRLKAAIAWSKWEAVTSSLAYKPSLVEEFSNPEFALAFALIENHYFVNKGWFKTENQIIENIDIIRSIPAVIVQGRYDVVCPMKTAWELSEAWPEAELIVAPASGHTAFEKEITHALISATDKFGKN